MGKIIKGLIYGGSVSVTVIKSTDIVNRAITYHKLSPVAAAALGRTLTATAYLGSRLKTAGGSVTVNIKGDGIIGGIVTACDNRGNVRGYAENPFIELPLKPSGKLDVSGAVGRGRMSVVRDLGLKEPFVAQVQLKSGEIAEDFTSYFAESEQQPSAVALGVLIGKDRMCKGAGGVILHLLPNCPKEVAEKAEKLTERLQNVSARFAAKTAKQVMTELFEDADLQILEESFARFRCKCSKSRIDSVLLTMEREELLDIAEKEGAVSVECHFCGKTYSYNKEDILSLKR